MILSAASAAIADLLRPQSRGLILKTLGLTILLLVAGWFGLRGLFGWWVMPWIDQGVNALPDWAGFLEPLAAIVVGLALAVGLALLLAPATALVAGLFLDEIAEAVEREDYPGDPPGRAMPTLASLVLSIKFLGVVILGNLIALFLLLVPGVNLVAFLVVNGYLLGREFFEFAAMRFRPEPDAKRMRRENGGTVFFAGLLIAGWLAVPILNLTGPFFAAAFMTHLHKALARRRGAGLAR